MFAYLIVLLVLNRIHWGIGLFCFCALASFCFVRKDLWLYRTIISNLSLTALDYSPGLQGTQKATSWPVDDGWRGVRTGILTGCRRYRDRFVVVVSSRN